VIGRNTQGVRLVRLDQGDRVVDVARVVSESSDSEALSDEPEDGSIVDEAASGRGALDEAVDRAMEDAGEDDKDNSVDDSSEEE